MTTLDDPCGVTDRNSPVSTGEFGGVSAERETADRDSSLQSEALTPREWISDRLQAARDYWVPPQLLSNPPESVAELSAYAHHGAWTSKRQGPVRALGVVWLRAVAIPVTAVCRYAEWIWQRPGRVLPVFVLTKLFLHTGPGPWISDNIIHPVLGGIAWVLL